MCKLFNFLTSNIAFCAPSVWDLQKGRFYLARMWNFWNPSYCIIKCKTSSFLSDQAGNSTRRVLCCCSVTEKVSIVHLETGSAFKTQCERHEFRPAAASILCKLCRGTFQASGGGLLFDIENVGFWRNIPLIPPAPHGNYLGIFSGVKKKLAGTVLRKINERLQVLRVYWHIHLQKSSWETDAVSRTWQWRIHAFVFIKVA